MLSFPAPKWSTALASVSNKPNGASNPRFGRAASLIIPRLYLSDYFTARDTEALNRLGITHVISVIEQDTNIPDCIPAERRLHIHIPDRADANILVHLDRTTQFITSALAENDSNKVLVHCLQGISRSATVVCAYLVATSGMLASEALAHTQAKRGIICPNIGFRKQLEIYGQRFVGKRSQQRESKGIGADIAERLRQLKGGPGTFVVRSKNREEKVFVSSFPPSLV